MNAEQIIGGVIVSILCWLVYRLYALNSRVAVIEVGLQGINNEIKVRVEYSNARYDRMEAALERIETELRRR